MKPTIRSLAALTAATTTLAVLGAIAASPASAYGTTYYVGGTGCADTNPGTQTAPFCTISAGAAAAGQGDTVLVSPGTYNEVVTVPHSGSGWLPLTIQSATPGAAVVTGGAHGFVVAGQTGVHINGFTVTGTTGEAFLLTDDSYLNLQNNTATNSGARVQNQTAAGFRLTNVSNSWLSGNTSDNNSDYGFLLNGTTTNTTLSRNEASKNAEGWQRNANGIDVIAAGNKILGNVLHDNEDSGLQFYAGGDNNVAADNVIYDNGDHGIDNLNVTGGDLIGNTVYNNCTDGINVEGTSSNYTVENNISMDNAVNTKCAHGPAGADHAGRGGDIGVYDTAMTGTVVDHNLVNQTAVGTKLYNWGANGYTTLAAFQAGSSQGANDIQANPQFINLAGLDFHLREGSPAIDSADSHAPGEQWTDAGGNNRVDDPNVADTGVGCRSYDDRGAYEFQPGPTTPPTAALTVTPTTGTAPVVVSADASATKEGTAAIVDYSFDFGDGTVVDSHTSPKAAHTYGVGGTYTVTVTATDSIGLTGTSTSTVTVTQAAALTAALTVTPPSGLAPLAVTADATGSAPAADPIASYSFDFGDGTVTGPQTAGTASHTYTAAGTYTVTVTVTDSASPTPATSTATATVTVTMPSPPKAVLKVTPSTFIVPLTVTADASGSTAGTSPIASYTFDFGDGTVLGPVTTPKVTHAYPTAGSYTVTLTVTDSATPTAATSQASTTLTANAPSGPIQYVGRAADEGITVTNTGTTVKVANATKAGDALIVSLFLTSTTPGTVTVTDTQGDTFSPVTDTFDSKNHRIMILAAFGAKALSTSDTLTFTWPSASKHNITVEEFTGITSVDAHSTGFGPQGGTTFTSGAATTTTSPELVFAAVGTNTGTVPTYDSPWMQFTPVSLNSYSVTSAYQIAATPGSYSATGTTSAQWAAALATFK